MGVTKKRFLFKELAFSAPDDDERTAALIYQGRCFEIVGRFPDARHCIAQVRISANGWEETLARIDYIDAGIDARKGKDESALRKLDQLMERLGTTLRTPEYEDLYENIQILRAGRLQNLNRSLEALPLFIESQNFTAAEMPSDHLPRMAYCLAQCGQLERGKALAKQLVENNHSLPEECTLRYCLGAINLIEKDYARALAEFHICEKHLDEFPLSVPDLMGAISFAYQKLGLPTEASRYRRASEDLPRNQ